MAKKQPAVEPTAPEDGKVSMQLRLDSELHEKLRKTAEDAGISLNQLIQGICWGAIENVVLGKGKRHHDGYVNVEQRKKCLFFGRAGVSLDPIERQEHLASGFNPAENDNGEYWFGLDFTNRGVVQ